MPAERALDFLKEYIDPDTGDAKYADQLVRRPLSAVVLRFCRSEGIIDCISSYSACVMQEEIANRERQILEIDIDDVASVSLDDKGHL